MRKILYFFLLLFSLSAHAQTADSTRSSGPGVNTRKVTMADKFREDGKIYVVVAVVLIIFLGMLFYIFTLEKKISRIEKEIDLKK
jgi:CcmD family protein